MSDSINAALRLTVRERVHGSCEYCGVPDDAVLYPHEPDHIIARKHGGATTSENLAYACFECNRAKGSDIASIDTSTGLLTPLFNPRQQIWQDHFRLNGPLIEPLTPTGRVTVALLHLNHQRRVALRDSLIREGHFPHTGA